MYFAYGSNMLPARLQARCSTARVIGTATAQRFELEFSKPGKDGSGKATLLDTRSQSSAIPGVLFEIDRTELKFLDRAEGAGYGYDRVDDFSITCATTGDIITATTYLASKTDPDLEPFDWYLALVLAGSHHNALHDDHQTRLRAVNHVVDTEESREGRIEALRALSEHGYSDHHSLLGRTVEDR
ncbi:gamma-glutamylcyclotransferase family protein [Jannaschia seohaensis]|nr:gamma-glutamylcyclotransferase family protein [Jannaschia seohaensis]